MKNVILGLALLLGSCATTKQDYLQASLKEHTQRCVCLLQPDAKIQSFQINWKNKEVLNKQIKHCQCTVQFYMEDVENPTDYVKTGTTFMQECFKKMPWDLDNERLCKVD